MFSPELAPNPPVSLSLLAQRRVQALLQIANAQQRLAALVDHARMRPVIPDAMRLETNRVPGCLVRTWFVPEVRDGRCYFHFDSDAAMLKAVIGFVCDLYSGHPPGEIASDDGAFLDQLGVLHQLAENRQRTVRRVVQQAREFARAHVSSAARGSLQAHPLDLNVTTFTAPVETAVAFVSA